MQIDAEAMRQVRAVVDRENRHSPEKVHAAMKLLGLEPEDVLPVSSVTVSSLIPDAERADKLRMKRQESFDRLTQDRVRRLQAYLSTMGEHDVSRYGRFVGDGVCVVRPEDLTDDQVMASGGGNDEFEQSQKQYARIKAEQQRKANAVATSFLTEKKKSEDAEAKVSELEKRLATFRKEQQINRKAISKEMDTRRQKCEDSVNRAAQVREEWENETLRKLEEKVKAASERRGGKDLGTIKDQLAAKVAAAEAKRRTAFMRAADMERRAIQRIQEKGEAVDQRLSESQALQHEHLCRRAAERQDKFQQKQLDLINQKDEWAENKLKQHQDFMTRYNSARQLNKATVAERAKSCSDLMKKRQEQARAINEKLRQEKGDSDAALGERHANAIQRVQSMQALGMKCDVDVHSHAEAKGLAKEMQTSRLRELQRKQEADAQALLVRLAEQRKRAELVGKDHGKLQKRRQQVQKETLTQADEAREGFLKIQSTSNEDKIRGVMASLGFEMPTLPAEGEEDEEQATKSKPAK